MARIHQRPSAAGFPEVWAFRETLPYNDTGKLLRRQLKADMSES